MEELILMSSIFDVDRKGLARLIRSTRGVHRLVWELISNVGSMRASTTCV